MADVFKQKPALYAQLKDQVTSKGVNLGHCIKTGIDNKSHPFVKTCGIVAGDEESYTLFAPLFDPIIEARHGGYKADTRHPSLNMEDGISNREMDPEGRYVLTTRIRTARSLSGFRLPACLTFDERREVERQIVKATRNLQANWKG